MTHHQINIHSDTANISDTLEQPPVPRHQYVVLEPIHKNGRTYQPDDVIELDEYTAQNFIVAGNIKENL